ncbi:MAG: HAMP domain-containing histidine kinase, partial [Deltaproteobacteria bacterium]|nr:HAMP domain-containing histidine kinase [Deltaproteobacteria bacterium]
MGELLALVAHDLRNPLSALHSNLGFLRSVLDDADPDAREAIDDGLVSCDGLAQIIDNLDLLAGALREPGRVPEAGSFVDVGALLDEVVHVTRAMAGSHGVELRAERAAGARLSALT